MEDKRRFTAIDLFSGCGGLSLGLRRARFNVIAAIDNDPLSISTYRKNHRRTRLIERDIKSVDAQALMEELKLGRGGLDLIAGCPPCQGFSSLRTLNGGREVKEPMNDLVFEFVRFVQVFLPKAIMMENVPALFHDNRLRQIETTLNKLGYAHQAKILNAAKYGVPQRRLRMILVGSREGCPPFAKPIRRHRTVAEAIRRMPPPNTSNDPIHNYTVRRSDRIMSIIRRISKDGGSRSGLPENDQLECHKGFDGFKDIYGRMAWHEPAPTITGGCISPSKGRFLHPQKNRAITLREAAMIQGFPKCYMFDMSRGRHPAAQMIGNAFPPKFAEHHARSIHQYLEENFSTNQ